MGDRYANDAGGHSTKALLPFLLILAVWCPVIRILWNDWRVDPQYGYGVIVPLLAFGLFFKRWEDRPSPGATHSEKSGVVIVISLLLTGLIAFLIPMAEANPDWRPLGVLASCSAVGITLSLTFLMGGVGWVRHFFMPCLFMLIAVPWPRNMEQSVMGGLMSWNTMTTMEILHWAGCEAMSQGNLIILPSGVLGIEEACSGIRSLQSGLMVALFFGEVFRLGIPRRILLLFIALLRAVIGNILRNAVLAMLASAKGLGSVTAWHDAAGIIVLLATIGVVFVCAFPWGRKVLKQPPRFPDGTTSFPWPSDRMIRPFVIASLAMIFGSLFGTEAWFRFHEKVTPPLSDWKLQQLPADSGAESVPISSRTLRMLFYPDGFSEGWKRPGSVRGQVFYFRWPPGRTASVALQMHNPEVCLSSIGMHLVQQLAPVDVSVHGVTIPFRSWLFEQKGKPVYVYHALFSEDGTTGNGGDAIEDTPKGRFVSMVRGLRNRGERMIEIAFWDLPDQVSADAALREYLFKALVPIPSNQTNLR
jgi:exosortase